jgi:hypothetical protein
MVASARLDSGTAFSAFVSLFQTAARRGGRWHNMRRNMGNPFSQDHQRHATDEQVQTGLAYAWREWQRRTGIEGAPTDWTEATHLANSIARRVCQLVSRGSDFNAERRGPRTCAMSHGFGREIDERDRIEDEETGIEDRGDGRIAEYDEDGGFVVALGDEIRAELSAVTIKPVLAFVSFGRRD